VSDRRSLRPPRAATLIVSAVLAASAAGGVLLYRLTAPARGSLYPAPQEPSSAVTSPAGAVLDGAPGTAPTAKIPEQLPDITLPGLDGVPRHLRDWQGQPLVINFWATWCEPCRREIPLLLALRRERSAQGLEVVGIAVDLLDAVRKYIPSHGIDYPVLVGEQGGLAAVSTFGMDTVLPFSVFVDRQGRVVTLKVGELHRDEANLILDRVRDVDAGTLGLAAARSQIADGLRQLSTSRATARSGAGALN
jgi:thiol-disulfide isomerase/thioredoxin